MNTKVRLTLCDINKMEAHLDRHCFIGLLVETQTPQVAFKYTVNTLN